MLELNVGTHFVFLVSNQKKELDLVLKIINTLYNCGRNYISLLETPFDVNKMKKKNKKVYLTF